MKLTPWGPHPDAKGQFATVHGRRELLAGALFRILRDLTTFPITVFALFYNRRISDRYGLSWGRLFRVAFRMYRNCFRVQTATSYKAHLVMLAKLLETPPEVDGVVVECGTFQGGSAINLSIACDLVGRDLIIYDSFAGLPEATPGDRYADPSFAGGYRGDLETVRANIARWGEIDRCTFRKGWFADTLPLHTEPVVACFIDVDYQQSLHDCLVNLWPHLTEQGHLFLDEYARLDYGSVFFSDRYWKRYLDADPPGLIGLGSGVPVGAYYVGPLWEQPPFQEPGSVAYTRRDFSGKWDYFP